MSVNIWTSSMMPLDGVLAANLENSNHEPSKGNQDRNHTAGGENAIQRLFLPKSRQ